MANRSSLIERLPPFPELPDFSNISTYDWTVDNAAGITKTGSVILCSFAFFRLLQFLVRWYLFGKWTFRTFDYFKFGRGRRRRTIPPSTELEVVPPNKKWRISNEAVSLIHSAVSGLWALYSLTTYEMTTSMMTFTHPVPKFLVYVSFGYIVHDLVDLLINERSIRILELLFHHLVVIGAFFVTLITNLFLPIVVLGLLMEINSIFLHSRSLMNLYRQPKNSTAFKFVKLLNIMTFVMFRVAVSLYCLYWWLSNVTTLHWSNVLINGLIICSLCITNAVLLWRVMSADGLLGASRARGTTVIEAPGAKSSGSSSDDDDDGNVESQSDSEGAAAAARTARSPRRQPTATSTTQTANADVTAALNAPEAVVVAS